MGESIEWIATEIVDSAIMVHRRVGPGMLESVYEGLLAQELIRRGLQVKRQLSVPFATEGFKVEQAFRVDLLVEGCIVIEVIAQEALARVHFKQVLTYLRALDLQLGFLINFGGATLREGIKRIVNNYRPKPDSPLRVNRRPQAGDGI